MLPSDIYRQRQADDPVLPPAVVLRIVRAHVPRAAGVTAVDESGGEARVYVIDEDIILKTQRPHRSRARTSLEKEAVFLDALAADPEVRVPRVIGQGRAEGVEYLCMTRMPGVAARAVVLDATARGRLLHALGRMLRHVHALPQHPFRASPLFPGPRTPGAFMRRFEEALREAVADIEREPAAWTLAAAPAAVAAGALAALASAGPDIDLVALHSNPGPEHVFVEPGTHALSGLIDFGDAYLAHPGFDWRWPEPADQQAILDGYAEEGELSEAFLGGWRASQLLADLTNVARRPERRAAAFRRIEGLLRD